MTNRHLRLGRRRQIGFTLIEVMIVVAIVAILSTIAYPSYRDYVTRGNIPTATSALAAKQVQMEQFFQDRRTYVGGDVAATIGTGVGCASDTSAKYFNFSCAGGDAPSATAYKISAIGKGSMVGFTFTIDQSGAKTTAAVPSGWSLPSPNTCWVTAKGGAC